VSETEADEMRQLAETLRAAAEAQKLEARFKAAGR
jgi:hypothetical protein